MRHLACVKLKKGCSILFFSILLSNITTLQLQHSLLPLLLLLDQVGQAGQQQLPNNTSYHVSKTYCMYGMKAEVLVVCVSVTDGFVRVR